VEKAAYNMHFDLLITNGTVFDGSGTEGFAADVGVIGNRIRVIGDLAQARAARIIDARNMAVCPGFVDPHTHTHWQGDPGKDVMRSDNLLRQGITTVMTGNCGKSGWPVGEHLDKVESDGFKSNYAMLAGHRTIREQAMADSDNLYPDPEQMKAMQDMVKQGLEEGAFGISVGYAKPHETTEELIEVTRPAAEAGAIYASHIRSEAEGLMQAIAEIIEIAQETGIRVHVSHLKTVRPANWGKLDIVLKMMEDAVGRGIDITADRYPYIVPATGATPVMPGWCYEEAQKRGGKEHLKDPDIIARFRQAVVEDYRARFGGQDKLTFISLSTPDPEIDGKTVADLMRSWNCELIDVVLEIERRSDAGGGIGTVGYSMSEDNLRRILQHPLVMIASDAGPDTINITRQYPAQPRSYGTYPRVLGRYVREEGILSLSEAIKKMTSMPAEQFGIPDRGTLRAGVFADIVIFDPQTVAETATFINAHQYPTGIPYVVVNGKVAVDNGETADEHYGRALRKDS